LKLSLLQLYQNKEIELEEQYNEMRDQMLLNEIDKIEMIERNSLQIEQIEAAHSLSHHLTNIQHQQSLALLQSHLDHTSFQLQSVEEQTVSFF